MKALYKSLVLTGKNHSDTYLLFSFPFQGRKRAEDLNERVMIWSFFVTISMIIVGLTQVCVLKSFFSEKKPSQMYGYH